LHLLLEHGGVERDLQAQAQAELPGEWRSGMASLVATGLGRAKERGCEGASERASESATESRERESGAAGLGLGRVQGAGGTIAAFLPSWPTPLGSYFCSELGQLEIWNHNQRKDVVVVTGRAEESFEFFIYPCTSTIVPWLLRQLSAY
jgi:hypothetical protein